MSHDLVQKLREIIDGQHRRAIEALETIEGYLDDVPESSSSASIDLSQGGQSLTARIQATRDRSIRERVFASIGAGYKSVEGILRDHPDLDKKQVWGVITAPDVRDRIDRATTPEGTVYRLKP
jgi:hypothetical protein